MLKRICTFVVKFRLSIRSALFRFLETTAPISTSFKPFAVKIDSVAEELQMELAEFQCDTILKQKYADEGIPKFYSFLSRERFSGLHSASARIIAMFGSTYVCEQFFYL